MARIEPLTFGCQGECATTVPLSVSHLDAEKMLHTHPHSKISFPDIFSLVVPAVVARLEPLTFGCQGECSTTVPLSVSHLDAEKMLHTHPHSKISFPDIFSLVVPAVVARLEPLTFGCHGECSTTVPLSVSHLDAEKMLHTTPLQNQVSRRFLSRHSSSSS